MGVYINREMPESCSVCFVKDCAARAKNKYVMSSRGQKCPIYLVPPHGRLIDADALMEIISKVIGVNASIEQRNEATDQERRSLWWFEEQVNIAQTIIPAEEGET